MKSEQMRLLLYSVAGMLLLFLLFYILNNLVGIVLMLAIGCGLGLGVQHVYPSSVGHSKVMATAHGLAGAMIGQWLLGSFGPSLAGVALVPSFVGALLVSYGLRQREKIKRAETIESFSGDNASDPLVGMRLDRYRLVRFLGAGGYARVYEAVPDDTLDKASAIAFKVFSEEALQWDDFLDRLSREVALCQRLDHPNIVKIFGSGQEGKIHFLKMEYVDGTTLTSRLEAGRLDLRQVLEWTRALASGLAHAHKAGVIHRDIKPDNVLLGTDGPKLTDFGLARLEGTSSLTQEGTALGTPYYMSPEQVKAEKVLDGRCDQYSLGCVVFELLTGDKLFEGDQAIQVLLKHVQEAPRDPRLLRMEIPERLSKAILKMVAKTPAERFASMDEVVAEFDWILQNLDNLPKAPRGPALAAP